MGQNKGKQVNLEKRDVLSNMLAKGASAKEIGEALGMSPTSIPREVMRNRIECAPEADRGGLCSKCSWSPTCRLHHVCGRRGCSQQRSGCASVASCHKFSEIRCNVAKRWPLCCNGCQKKAACHLAHFIYDPVDANSKARSRLVDSRSGADMTEDEKEALDAALYDAVVAKKQSIHHALAANPDAIKCSEKTAYRLVASGILRVRNIDLPRQPGLKKRKRKSLADGYAYVHGDVDRTGHLYSDWLIFRSTHMVSVYFEMDFLGKPHRSSKEVLVLTLPGLSFSLLYIIEGATQEKVGALFDSIEDEIGIGLFKRLFPAILTDRDVVFDGFSRIEIDRNGEKRTSVYFCNPAESNQKPHVENYNGQLRVPIPKDMDLSGNTQEELYHL